MTALLDLPDPEWLAILRGERANGRSVSDIARMCGVPRSTISMLLSGSYPAQSLDQVERRHGPAIVRALRGMVLCPHLRRSIGGAVCAEHAAAPMSMSNVAALRHWEACRACRLNPQTGEVRHDQAHE